MTLSADATRRLRAAIESQSTHHQIPTAMPRRLQDELRRPSPVSHEVQHWHIIQVLNDHRTSQSAIQYQYGDGDGSDFVIAAAPESPDFTMIPGQLPQLRSLVSIGTSNPPPAKRQKLNPSASRPASQPSNDHGKKTSRRKARTCKYCQSAECPGRWKVASCRVKPLVGVI